MKKKPAHYQGKPGMIISCPNCKTRFRIDETRIGPQGKKVRCSKCGHIWRASPNDSTAVDEPVKPQAVPAEGAKSPNPAGETSAPKTEAEVAQEETVEPSAPDVSASDAAGPAGLTGEQRAKLDEARQQKPRSRFWIKVLIVFIVVAAILLVARSMMPWKFFGTRMLAPASSSSTTSPPPSSSPTASDVGTVEAKPVPKTPTPE